MSFMHRNIVGFVLCVICALAHAESPVWTFTPLTATSITLASNATAVIQYIVTNQSSKSHTLAMTPIQGISQLAAGVGICPNPFTLSSKGASCVLSLQADGSQLSRSVNSGPIVCEQGSALQCYGPSSADILNITLETVTATTLSASVSTLALSVNDTGLNPALTGTPRMITLTNTGSANATAVTYSPSPALPSGTTIAPADCGTIAPSGTCVLTITPGNTPSASPGDTAPTPISLSIAGSNTNTVNVSLNILTYGSVYQSGYLYAVDDSTPDSGSMGGSVVTLTDQAERYPDGIVWASNGTDSLSQSFDIIPGISETSTPGSPDPTYSAAQSNFNTTYSNSGSFPFPSSGAFLACNGNSDGACNSANILTLYNTYETNYGIGPSPYTLSNGPTNITYYAAGLCESTIAGYSDWHLPAVCEMGPNSNGSGCTGGTQNIIDQIPDLLGDPGSGSGQGTSCAYGANCLTGFYWSSTQSSSAAFDYAWDQYFATAGASVSNITTKNTPLGVRCTRALTF